MYYFKLAVEKIQKQQRARSGELQETRGCAISACRSHCPIIHTSHTIPAPEARHLGGVGVTYQGRATPEPEGESPPGTRLRQLAAALHIPLRPVWVALRENWLRRGQDILTPYLCRFAGNLVAAVTGFLTPWVTCRSCPAFPIVPLFHTSHTSHTSPALPRATAEMYFSRDVSLPRTTSALHYTEISQNL